ncbi:PEP-CTERM sorting domain-containing protein [Citrifermentans bremense]|uniref:PEP-CTERM sorting domain-containing protein n=1 Tax=Citrifermentans bremense TaxID=60035 RepID=UPI00047BF0BB|nr:PEP-CTERM sorting domain-containing protein [Citrifermentans bremense]
MKRLALLLFLTATLFLSQTRQTEATVIYDWVTHGVNIGDSDSGCNFNVTAQWSMSDQEYWNRLSFAGSTTNNLIPTVQVLLNDQSLWTYTFAPMYYMPFYSYFGKLSDDRTTIVETGSVYADHLSRESIIWANDNGDGLFLSPDRANGGLFIANFYFDELRHPATGDWARSFWDLDGEWVVRQDTVPTPEPATFILVGAGVVAVVLTRRITK